MNKKRLKKEILIGIGAGLLAVAASVAHAGNVIKLSKDALVTVEHQGRHLPLTMGSMLSKDDVITVHKGSIKVLYNMGRCEQTLLKNTRLTILENANTTCGKVISLNEGMAAQTASNTAIAGAGNGALVAGGVSAMKLLAIGGGVLAAVIVADNKKSSPD